MVPIRNLMRNPTVYFCQKLHFVNEKCKFVEAFFQETSSFEILFRANSHQRRVHRLIVSYLNFISFSIVFISFFLFPFPTLFCSSRPSSELVNASTTTVVFTKCYKKMQYLRILV